MAKPKLQVSVFSDYICPFCYVGSRRLPCLDERYQSRIKRCGLEICPATPAAGMAVAELGYEPERWDQAVFEARRLAGEESLEPHARGITTTSRRAPLPAEAVKQAGRDRFCAAHEGLFEGYFRQGCSIGDERQLHGSAALAGPGQKD